MIDGWYAAACQLLAPHVGGLVSIICIVLGILLLVAIALGFGPLSTWLGLSTPRRGEADRAFVNYEGLLGIWQLYRALRGATLLRK